MTSKHFSCSTQLSMKFIMLINIKMPTIVGILIFMSMTNTASEHNKARNYLFFKHFRFYEHLKFQYELSKILNYINFVLNICCLFTKEPSRQDDSFGGTNSICFD